jgi:hypothetical protein
MQIRVGEILLDDDWVFEAGNGFDGIPAGRAVDS